MDLRLYSDASEFRDQVFHFLCQNEAQNCLGIGIINTLINQPEIYPKFYLWALIESGKIKGVAWLTSPHPIGLSNWPDQALDLLVDEVSKLPELPKAVVGPDTEADAFARKWTALHGSSIRSTIKQRIYQLEKVIIPFPVPGEMRVVNQNDQTLLEEWSASFIRDCGMGDGSGASDYAAHAIKSRSRYFWIVDGEPVSMAGASGSTPSGIRINWVYTPNSLRGCGYASALVAQLSQKMLDEGRKFCFLYTDLSNPTSNSIYQKIGYRPVSDSTHHNF